MKTLYLLSLLLLSGTLVRAQDTTQATAAMRQELESTARVATVMVDGDVCQRIVTPLAKEFMFKVDPRNQWMAGDNYNVDDVAFNATKKTLIRLSHLTSFPSDFNLWMPIDGHAGKIQVVIRNKNEMSQFWRWGDLYQDAPPAMQTVLGTGRQVTVTDKPGWISVLAPVYNSLGDVVGLVEAVTRVNLDAHENVK